MASSVEARIVKLDKNCFAVEYRWTKYSGWATVNKEFRTRVKASQYIYGRFGLTVL